MRCVKCPSRLSVCLLTLSLEVGVEVGVEVGSLDVSMFFSTSEKGKLDQNNATRLVTRIIVTPEAISARAIM